MSQETESLLEKALYDHLVSEDMIGEGDLLNGWIAVVDLEPGHVGGQSSITVIKPKNMNGTLGQGLLHFALHEAPLIDILHAHGLFDCGEGDNDS